MKARMPNKGMLTAKQRTLPKALQAKISKFRASMKNMKLSKGIYKGVKFAAKTATSPISLGIGAGFLGAAVIKKQLNEPIVKRKQQFNKKGLSIL